MECMKSMKSLASCIIGRLAGLAIFGIGCTSFYPIILFFWVTFGLAASFVVFAISEKHRLKSIFITALSLWIAVSVVNTIYPPRMTKDEMLEFIVGGGLITAFTFLPAFLIGLILKLKSKKASKAVIEE